MAENDYQRGQAGIQLARWQGGVDETLKQHAEHLAAVNGDLRAIRESLAGQHDDLRDIKRATHARSSASRFRWTKATVFIAAAAVLATIVLNLYFASGTHH